MKKAGIQILGRSVGLWVVMLGITGIFTLVAAHVTRATVPANNPNGPDALISTHQGHHATIGDGTDLPSIEAFKSAILRSVPGSPSIRIDVQEYWPVHGGSDFRLAVFDRSGVHTCFKYLIRP